jgi:hypothetical protein
LGGSEGTLEEEFPSFKNRVGDIEGNVYRSWRARIEEGRLICSEDVSERVR